MWSRIGIAIVGLAVLASSAAAEVQVVWSGSYNGRQYPPRVYSRSSLCCSSQRCGMRRAILAQIEAEEARQAMVRTAPKSVHVNTRNTETRGMEAYQVTVPYEQTYTESVPYQVKVCQRDRWGRVTGCRLVTKYRTETRTRTAYRVETRYRPVVASERPPLGSSAPVAASGADVAQKPAEAPTLAQADSIVEVSAEDLVLRLEPTPMPAVRDLLSILQPQPGELLVDLGCGDGRIVAEACREYGCRGLGIELNAETVAIAREASRGVEGLSILEGDVLEVDWSAADIVVMYLYPDLIVEIWPKVPSGTLVASLEHELPGPCRKLVRGDAVIYVGVKR